MTTPSRDAYQKNKSAHEQQHFTHRLADFSPAMLYVLDLEAREIIYVNNSVEVFLGHTAEYVYEKGHAIFKEALHPEDYERRMAHLEACINLAGSEAKKIDVRLKSASGQWRWFRITDKAYRRDEQGQVMQAAGFMQDVHEEKEAIAELQEEHRRLKQAQVMGELESFERPLPGDLFNWAEEKLQEQEAQYRSLIENTSDVVTRWDKSLKLIFTNEAFEKMMGVPIHKLIGKNMSEMGLSDAIALPWMQSLRKVFETDETVGHNNFFPTPNGEAHFFNRMIPERNGKGEVESVLAIARDNSELKKAEEQFRLFISASSDVVYKMSADWSQMLQLNSKNFLADTKDANSSWLEQYIPAEEQLRVQQAIRQAIALKATFELEHQVIRADSAFGWTFSRAVPVLNSQAEIVEWFGTASDITSRKVAELEAKQKQELLQATLNSSLDMIQVFEAVRDRGGDIVDFRWILNNHTSEKAYGNVIGESLLRLNPGVVEAGIFDTIKKVVETGVADISERNYVHEQFNGWFLQSVTKLDDGVVTSTTNITEIKKAEQELRESKALLQEIIDAPNIGLAVYKAIRDEQGRIVDFVHEFVNRITVAMLDEDVTGKLLSDHGQAGLSQLSKLIEVIETGKTNNYIIHAEFSGRLRWSSFSNTPLDGDRLVHTWEDITEHKQAETELLRVKEALAQQATQKYNELFQSIDQGFCTIAMKYDEEDQPIDYQFLEISPSFEQQTGIREGAGKWMRDIAPDHEEFWFKTYGRVAKDRKSKRFEYFSTPLGRWWSVYAFPIDAPELRRVGVLFYDITERKTEEEKQAYLLKLNDTLRPFTDPVEIQATAAQVLGEHLGADRAYYVEIDQATQEFIVARDWHKPGAPSHARPYPLASWSMPWLIDGKSWVVRNTDTDPAMPDDQRDSFRANNIGAAVVVPLIKQGQLVVTFVINQEEPRNWTAAGIALVEETAERTWAAVERAKAEEALRASEEKYRTIFTNIDEGFVINELLYNEAGVAYDFQVLEANQRFHEMMQVEEAAGKRAREIFSGVDTTWFEVYQQVVVTGKSVQFEKYLLELDSWFELHLTRVGEEGSPVFAIVFNDITERKRSEANLAFLNEVSQDLAHLTSIGETMATLGSKIGRHFRVSRCAFVEINEAADEAVCKYDWHRADSSSLVGIYRIAEFYTEDFLRILRTGKPFVTNDIEADLRVDAKKLAALNIASFIVIPIIKDGELQFVNCIYSSCAREWQDYEIELMREMTARIWTRLERASAEVALRLSEDRLQKVLSIKTVGVFYFDLDGTIHDANAAFERVSGYSKEELASGKVRWDTLTPPEFMPITLKSKEELLSMWQNTPYEKQYIRPDGSRWWGVFAGKRLSESEFVEFVVDISEQKRAEEQLKNFNQQLEQLVEERTQALLEAEKLSVKGQLARTIAHEVRGPLVNVNLALEMLQKKQTEAERERYSIYHQIITTSNQRIEGFITELLNLSKNQNIGFELHNLKDIVEEALGMAKDRLFLKSITVEKQYDEDCMIKAQPERLKIAILNLIHNAVEAMEAEKGVLKLLVRKNVSYTALVVQDNGCGMNKEQLSKMFDAYYTSKPSGLGVGLANVRAILQRHGARIKVESKPGEGTTFFIYFDELEQ